MQVYSPNIKLKNVTSGMELQCQKETICFLILSSVDKIIFQLHRVHWVNSQSI
nr:hypothetical protein Iba_chr12cCG23030 [Ipomoea batatas]GMD71311.1 hypothetical protein Iba_chr12eCG14730 [Ipomoea batatas]GME05451.1 hypothetical protein Iba_scaffold2905CG0040 [Ipomoea batatas]